MRLSILLLLFFVSCSSGDVPKGVMPPEKMKTVLFDVMRADEFANNYIASDTSKDLNKECLELYQKVFALHKTDHKAFYNSLDYYQKHPDQYKLLVDSLAAYTKRIDAKPLILKRELPTADTLKVRELKPEILPRELVPDSPVLKTN